MKKRWADSCCLSVSLILIVLLAAISCMSISSGVFGFENSSSRPGEPRIGIVKGSVSYGAGFYLPTDASTLDISLLMVNPADSLTVELSHQRIRNIQRFPFQFSIRFDESELQQDCQYRIVMSFTNDGKSHLTAQTANTAGYPPDNISLTLS